jgi:RNA polymerase sigma-70 factor (family 1)
MTINQKLVSRIAEGHQKSFKQLMEHSADELFVFAKGFIRNSEAAEEIVSDVFVKIWKNRSEIHKIKNLKAYLFISVKNGCLSHLRKSKKDKIISIDEFNDFHFLQMEGPETEHTNEEIISQIYDAIEKLPPKCKLAFTLAKTNGLRHKEIAEIMKISAKTVNNHIVSAIKKITLSITANKKRTILKLPLKKAALY